MSEQDEIRALGEQVRQLTARVYRLEQAAPTHAATPEPTVAPPQHAPALPTPAIQQPIRPVQAMPAPPLSTRAPAEQTDSLERRIGSQWLNRVGVVAVLIGVSYFLKLAFDNGWVGPGVRVLLGVVAGAALCWWSERFRRPASMAFSYSLKAVGVGILYLSLWASFQLYHLLPAAMAFLAMMLVTAATAAIAITQDAELIAGLSLLGGILTPVLCSTSQNHEAALFCYLLLLSAGAFVLQRLKPWPGILLGAFAGAAFLGAAWYDSYYTADQFGETLVFFSLLFGLFAFAPLYAVVLPESDLRTRQTGLVLAVSNAVVYFRGLWVMLSPAPLETLAAYAFGLAVFYAALAVALDRRATEHSEAGRLMPLVHYGLAVTLLTAGIALRLHEHWITLAWLVEGALLFWAGARTRRHHLKLLAGGVVALGVLRLLILDLDRWGTQPTLLNPRFATMLVAIAALLCMIYLDRDVTPDGTEAKAVVVASVLVNLLALLALGMEIHDGIAITPGSVAFGRGPSARELAQARHGLEILRSFSYSALFMLYGAGLMWLGFAKKSVLLRWQAIVLMACSVVKVFVVDAWELEHGWRVLSFIFLGVILLGVSYAYQSDWLGLQRPHSE